MVQTLLSNNFLLFNSGDFVKVIVGAWDDFGGKFWMGCSRGCFAQGFMRSECSTVVLQGVPVGVGPQELPVTQHSKTAQIRLPAESW